MNEGVKGADPLDELMRGGRLERLNQVLKITFVVLEFLKI